MNKYNRNDFLETNLLPSLKTNQSNILGSFEQHEMKFLELKQRLDEVRNEKLKRYYQELESKRILN